MSFTRENLTVLGNSLKSGNVPSLYAYFNEDDDTVTTADFFNDRRLRVGDQIEVISSDYTAIKFYVVSAVTTLAGTATVVASDLAIDDIVLDAITATGKIETTSTALDSIKTAGDIVAKNIKTTGRCISNITTDGADSSRLLLNGGGGEGSTRGAQIGLAGNEDATIPGAVYIDGGNIAGGGEVVLRPRSTSQVRVAQGKLQVDDTTEATTTTDGAGAIAGGLSVAKNVVVGGDIYTTALTQWTPTVGVSGSNTAPTYTGYINAWYKQVGKTISYQILLNNTSGGTAGSGTSDRITISLPSGKGWGSTKYTQSGEQAIGVGHAHNGGTYYNIIACPSDADKLSLYFIAGAFSRFNPIYQNNVNRQIVIQGFYEIN